MAAYEGYLENHKKKKTKMKCFVEPKIMLSGVISNFDSDCIILDECLINFWKYSK